MIDSHALFVIPMLVMLLGQGCRSSRALMPGTYRDSENDGAIVILEAEGTGEFHVFRSVYPSLTVLPFRWHQSGDDMVYRMVTESDRVITQKLRNVSSSNFEIEARDSIPLPGDLPSSVWVRWSRTEAAAPRWWRPQNPGSERGQPPIIHHSFSAESSAKP